MCAGEEQHVLVELILSTKVQGLQNSLFNFILMYKKYALRRMYQGKSLLRTGKYTRPLWNLRFCRQTKEQNNLDNLVTKHAYNGNLCRVNSC